MSKTPMLDLLKDPDRWCQGSFALDENGNDVEPTDPNACRFCLHGAAEKLYQEAKRHSDALSRIRKAILMVLPEDSPYHLRVVANFNDTATHAMVVDVLRKARV